MIKVTIDGPGGILTYESEVIRRALVEAGVEVEVTYGELIHTADDALAQFNRTNNKDMTFDQYFAWLSERMKTAKSRKVVLQINNHPWGG